MTSWHFYENNFDFANPLKEFQGFPRRPLDHTLRTTGMEL